jgi:5-methylcytosine-specific restriction endonuclease McrA
MVMGFVTLLGIMSTAEDSDYVVGIGQVKLAGGECWRWLLEACIHSGLLKKNRKKRHSLDAYTLIDDPDFIHIILKSEKDWANQQRAETRDPMLGGKVRRRDGDNCRYCGRRVRWRGKKGPSYGTLDHIDSRPLPDGTRPKATPETMVVACLSCNSSIGDKGGDDRPTPLDPPAVPHYGNTTLALLLEHRMLDGADGQRPYTTEDTAPSATTRKRPAKADTARPAASAPAKTGHRAASDESQNQSQTRKVDQTDSAGTGRDGTGSDPLLPPNPLPAQRRRKRSTRGGRTAQPSASNERNTDG